MAKVKCVFCLLDTEKRLCWEVNIKGPSSKTIKTVHDEDRKSNSLYACHACYLMAKPSCIEYCSKLSKGDIDDKEITML